MSTRRVLICGISGQDGSYLAQFLLEKGYEVWGTSRDAQASTFGNLSRLGILHGLRLFPWPQMISGVCCRC